jgi:hypothetical protein
MSFLQVIFRASYWIKSWAILPKEEEKNDREDGLDS